MTERLDIVLRHLQELNVTVNPEKCSFGRTNVEFVGHTVDRDELHFSREKLDRVLMGNLPQREKGLNSFLRVCVYFNEHVHHYSDLVAPLCAMIRTHEPQRLLHRTTATKKKGVLRITKGSQRMPDGSLRKHRMADIRGIGRIRLRKRSHLLSNERRQDIPCRVYE